MTLKTHSHQPAFTLAELLVTLGLLGVIAAFTIPKLTTGTNTQEREANFRKGISVIQTLLDDGVSTGELTENNVGDYFLDDVKAPRKCWTNYDTENCYPTLGALGGGDPAALGAGFILPGGLTVVDFDNVTCTSDEICGDRIVMDWNGQNAPNAYGEDQMQLCFSFGVTAWTIAATPIPPGGLYPCPDHAASETLYNTVMN